MFAKFQYKVISFYKNFNVETGAKKVGGFLKLFHESMTALVQGYREVTMDAKGKFRFEEDGKTV